MPGNRARVLVVEDHLDARRELAETLREAGYDVLEAKDGKTALTLAASGAPNLILQDLILPDAPGFELLEQLRALPGGDRIPIVAVSGFAERAEDAVASGVRFDAYLSKPFGAKRLCELVASLIHRPDAN